MLLLARLLGRDLEEPVALAEAVEGSAALVDLKMPTGGHPLLPILSSISEHRTLGGDPSWKGSVGRWNIDPGHSDQRQLFLPVAEDGIGRFMGDGGSV